jgi:DNA-binding transcriptional MerR regulator
MNQLANNSQAAECLGIAAATLQYWRTTGAQNLPFIKIGRRVMYRQDDIDKWLKQHTFKHTGEYQAGGSNHE